MQKIIIKVTSLATTRIKPGTSFIAKLIIFPLFFLTVAGCTTTNSSPIGGEKSTQDRFGHAIISPLSDLNIVQTGIPPVIQEAVKHPYQIPDDISCEALVEQIHKLDLALGDDLDALALRKEKTTAEKSGEFIQNEAIGSVERTISGSIPFRSWIRKLTGAEKHSREIGDAIAAGIVQRAFLKGIGKGQGCTSPEVPLMPPAVVPLDVPISTETPAEAT